MGQCYLCESTRHDEDWECELAALRTERDGLAEQVDKLQGILEMANNTAKRRGEKRDELATAGEQLRQMREALEKEQEFSRFLVPSQACLLSRQWHKHYGALGHDWDSERLAGFLKRLISIVQRAPFQVEPTQAEQTAKENAEVANVVSKMFDDGGLSWPKAAKPTLLDTLGAVLTNQRVKGQADALRAAKASEEGGGDAESE